MDDIVQVLLFVLTLAIFIFSALRKQKKRPEAKPSAADDLLESIFGIPPTTQVFIPEDEIELEVPLKEVPANPLTVPLPEEGIVAVHNTIITERDEEETFIPAIDLRTAIIYNEILTRKYS
jgi:hypothetical protein